MMSQPSKQQYEPYRRSDIDPRTVALVYTRNPNLVIIVPADAMH